jgi:ribonuclease Z
MTPLFQPRLLNSPFGDPALYVGLQGEGTALLFDVGDISRVSSRLLFKISDVFISHTHIDHCIGIDHLLRLNLARNRILRLYGPPGIIANMTGKLRGYTWNLTDSYPFMLDVYEIGSRIIRIRRFSCSEKFKPGPEQRLPFDGVIINCPAFRVLSCRLDHNGIASLAFRLEEHNHININKDTLSRRGLPVGPWLQTLKKCIREGSPDSTEITVPETDGLPTRTISLEKLKREIVHITQGESIAYIADSGASPENIKKIKLLADGVDRFFCEAAFLERDAAKAHRSGHFTARQAGLLARSCGAKKLTVFHFSPRYENRGDEPEREAMHAFTCG